ncbi:MAG TPA: mechanosensitive ion channel family protein [Thermoanaerobaculia bacterium]|nr:mechanosensitive ion channel family protein [Thermoanaerobaculia bacterium]
MRHRGARLLPPLAFAAGFTLLYFFALNNAKWIDSANFDQKTVLRTLKFIAWVPGIFFIVRLVDLLAFDILSRRRGRVKAPALLRELVSIGIAVVLFAIIFSTVFDKSVTAFLATGTVLAAILGFALQDTLGNLFAGISLHLEDSFEIGDVIRAGEFIGTVEAVRWRGARIRTFNNTIVIIPNSVLARERVEVYPRNNFNARILQLTVDYNVPPSKVIDILVQAASNVEGISHAVPCIARVGGFADSGLIYEIKYFTEDFSQRDRIDAEIRKAAWYALRRNGITITLPIRAVRKYEPPQHRSQPDVAEIAARLSGVHFLESLSEEVRTAIAAAARVHTYSRGETIIRQGAEGNSMFIIHDGTVSARVATREVGVLTPGDFFGEMALLTGEARTADIVAVTDVVAIEIAKDILQPVLKEHPELADVISSEVASRTAVATKITNFDDTAPGVLSRIRSYFHL